MYLSIQQIHYDKIQFYESNAAENKKGRIELRGIPLLIPLLINHQGSTPWDQKAGFLQYSEFGISTEVMPAANRNFNETSHKLRTGKYLSDVF